jgi:MYXO-CTERM domain-containing protein
VYLFISFLVLRTAEAPADAVRVPGGPVGAGAVGASGLVVTLLAMAIAMVPPDGESDPLLFELKVVGGALGFVALGGLVYWRRRSR